MDSDKKGWIFAVSVPVILLVFAAVYDNDDNQTDNNDNQTLSVGLIISDISSLQNTKRTVKIRLDERVDEATLQAIAYKIKKMEQHKYHNTFINYYLPGNVAFQS